MLTQEFISPSIPSLSLQDTAQNALELMEDNQLMQLPLVDNENYLGLVSEDVLLDLENTSLAFSEFSNNYFCPAIQENLHFYEAIKIMVENNLTILPVIDKKNIYKGSINQNLLFAQLANGIQAKENGGIIEVEVSQINFSLSQLARIFESENVNILSVQINTNDNNNLLITLKTNKQDLRAVVATLERLNYIVKEIHSLHNDNEDLENNFNSFMHYLNM